MCGGTVNRCDKCASLGCDQVQPGECSNQAFWFGTCMKCGTMSLGNDLRLVLTPQLEHAIKVLHLSLPERASGTN